MNDLYKKSAAIAISVFSLILTVVPEDMFKYIKFLKNFSDGLNIIFNRTILFLIIFLLTMFLYKACISIKWWRTIKGKNYTIVVRYQDIFKIKNCKKVIPFDECYTTDVGEAPGEIKPTSICGQYLTEYPIINVQDLIKQAKLRTKGKSKYQNKDRYESGVLVPNQDYLLLAFAKLDKEGLGRMTRQELVDCLMVLWEEIDKHYGQQDICIPILGSGITRMDDSALMQQELLDVIILTYKLSASKIKKPNKLIIACKRAEDFSLYKIGEYI